MRDEIYRITTTFNSNENYRTRTRCIHTVWVMQRKCVRVCVCMLLFAGREQPANVLEVK